MTAQPALPGQATPPRPCAWCPGTIPEDARSDAIYCSKRCRQAAHRFRRGYQPKPRTDRPLELAYADPPYPGTAARYYAEHPDYAGEVDHAQLVDRLVRDFPDGWALSTSARALGELLELSRGAGADPRVAIWVRGIRPTRSSWPLNAYEPVIYSGGRQDPPEDGPTKRQDVLVYAARARLTDARRVTGAKPAEFLWWLFELLGARPGDQLFDLYPGSGGVSRAWTIFQDGPPRPQRTPRGRRRAVAADVEHDGTTRQLELA